VAHLKTLLAAIGLEPDRVAMFNLSAVMAGQFVEAVKTLVETISALGPSPLRVAGARQTQKQKQEHET
jgi:coenzyme F420-reducing hydrogenase delta subunit